MACNLIPLNNQSGDCADIVGGIYKSKAINCDEIDLAAVTFDANGCITSLPIIGGGTGWVEYVYNDNSTASYQQTGNRTGKKITFDQTASFEFSSMTKEGIAASNAAKSCCCIIFVHYMNNNLQVVQGLEASSTGGAKLTTLSPTVTPSAFTEVSDSDTGARTVWEVTSTGTCLSPLSELDPV